MILLNKTLLYFDVPTLNGIVYTKSELTRDREWSCRYGISYTNGTLLEKLNGIMWLNEKIWRKDEYKEPYMINKDSLYGELEHSNSYDITMASISHKITNIRIEDNKLVGDVKIIDTLNGKAIKNIVATFGEDEIIFRPRSIFKPNNELMIFTFDALPSSDDPFKVQDKQLDKVGI